MFYWERLKGRQSFGTDEKLSDRFLILLSVSLDDYHYMDIP